MSIADAPRAVEQNVKVYSPNHHFYALSLLKEKRTAIFRVGASKQAVWEMPGYHPVMFLANDGEHLVEGYAGANLLDGGVKGTDTFLVFFVGCKRIATITVAEMFPHLEVLPQTTSGRAWGNFWGFETATKFTLLMHDDRKVSFDADTGTELPR